MGRWKEKKKFSIFLLFHKSPDGGRRQIEIEIYSVGLLVCLSMKYAEYDMKINHFFTWATGDNVARTDTRYAEQEKNESENSKRKNKTSNRIVK